MPFLVVLKLTFPEITKDYLCILKLKKMKLKRIKIQNFKCFQKQQNIDFERLTILTGANSSGKSSILYSILGSIQSGEFPLQFSTNGKYVNMGDFREIAFNHIANSEVNIGFTFENGSVQNISSTWTEDKQNNLPQLKSLFAESPFFELNIKKSKKYSLDFNYYPEKDPSAQTFTSEKFKQFISSLSSLTDDVLVESNSEDNLKNKVKSNKKKSVLSIGNLYKDYDKPQEIKNHQFKDFEELKGYLLEIGSFRLQRIIDEISKIFQTFDDKVNYISSFRLHPERTYLEKTKSELKVEKFGEGYLDQIIFWQTKKSKKFTELIHIMKKLSLLQEIVAKRIDGGRFEMMVKTKENGTLTSISDVGFGISQFLPIIVADLQLPIDSTLFVAQPEIHLHPSVQSLFGDYLVDQINTTNKNYVVETHSEYLLNRIRLAIVKGQLKEDELSIYFVENKADDAILHKIKFAKNGQILNAPEDFFKTYMMDVMEIALNAE